MDYIKSCDGNVARITLVNGNPAWASPTSSFEHLLVFYPCMPTVMVDNQIAMQNTIVLLMLIHRNQHRILCFEVFTQKKPRCHVDDLTFGLRSVNKASPCSSSVISHVEGYCKNVAASHEAFLSCSRFAEYVVQH